MSEDDLGIFQTLGQYVGPERLNTEYKQFCLKSSSILLENDEIREIIKSGVINTNLSNLISNSLKDYILFILPKYIATFSNSNIDGKLIFGIDDTGIITGIPSIRPFRLDKIKIMVKKSIKDNLSSEVPKEDIFKNIKITIKKLEIDKQIYKYDSDISESLLQTYINAQNDLERKKKKFSEDYYIWYQELLIYSTRLQNLVNKSRTRNELKQYIIERNLEKEKIDVTNIINDLESDKIIEIPDQFGLRWDLEVNIDYKIFNINENLFKGIKIKLFIDKYNDNKRIIFFPESIFKKYLTDDKKSINFNTKEEFIKIIFPIDFDDITEDTIILGSDRNIYRVITNGEVIGHRKEDPFDVIYWLVKFKDYMVQNISKKKPMRPYISCGFTLFSILSNLSNMTKKFLENPEINYYIIIFEIKGSQLNKSILYKLFNSDWIFQNRIVGINGDPVSS